MSEKLIAYCLKCKEKQEMLNPKAEWAANGSPATRGKCSVCGTNMYMRGKTAAHETLPKPDAATLAANRKKAKATAKKSGKKTTGRKKKATKTVRRAGKLVIVESPAKA
ncbi:MAG TPA: hypothetical protein ENJ56_07755, partial [Anaerolineae bacterium]|nr:hypothetical protein [Anaerolineae bacterium]